MSANLKPYPAMKDSGVPWLGEVPTYWEVVRLRNTSEMRVSNVDKHAKDDEQPVRLCNYVDVYKNDRIRSGMAFMRATATTDEIERFRLQSGDVLITKDSEAWNDIGVPALVEDTQDDTVSGYHLALLRPFPERVDGGYLFRALQSPAVAYQFHVEANGVTRYGLSHSAIRSVWLPLPPLSEQAAIVRFLDYADRRIRRYIRAQQQLIALLEEQKQALIHQAVTGQIDVRTGQAYPAYKDSGVEWLGEVPAHWEVRRLRSIAHIKTGSRDTVDRVDDGKYPFFVRSQTAERINTWSFEGEAILTAGDGAGVAKVFHYANGKFDYHQRVYRLSNFREVVGRFLFEYFRATLRFEALAGTAKSTVDSLRQPILENFPVALPPQGEQDVIVRFLDKTTASIDEGVASTRRGIDLFREYRTRLIADVVTGKLDVTRQMSYDGEEEPTAALATAP